MRNILITIFTTVLLCITGGALAVTQLDNAVNQARGELSLDRMNANTNSTSDIQKLRQKSDANINVGEPMTKKHASEMTNTNLEKGKSHTTTPSKGGVDVYGGVKSNISEN